MNTVRNLAQDGLRRSPEKMIGFIMPNAPNKSIYKFAVSVDEVERRTGLDFFPNLAKPEQARLESQCDVKAWNASASKAAFAAGKRRAVFNWTMRKARCEGSAFSARWSGSAFRSEVMDGYPDVSQVRNLVAMLGEVVSA